MLRRVRLFVKDFVKRWLHFDLFFCESKSYTVKRPRYVLLIKVQICLGPGLILYRHFRQPHVAEKNILWLLKVSMHNESGPEAYSHY